MMDPITLALWGLGGLLALLLVLILLGGVNPFAGLFGRRGPELRNVLEDEDGDRTDLRVCLNGPNTLVARKFVANVTLATGWLKQAPRGQWHRRHTIEYLLRFCNTAKVDEDVRDVAFSDVFTGGEVVPGSIRVRLNGADLVPPSPITAEAFFACRTLGEVLNLAGMTADNQVIGAGKSLDVVYHVRATRGGGTTPDDDLAGAPAP